jgi:hypothetical protein
MAHEKLVIVPTKAEYRHPRTTGTKKFIVTSISDPDPYSKCGSRSGSRVFHFYSNSRIFPRFSEENCMKKVDIYISTK